MITNPLLISTFFYWFSQRVAIIDKYKDQFKTLISELNEKHCTLPNFEAKFNYVSNSSTISSTREQMSRASAKIWPISPTLFNSGHQFEIPGNL